MADITIDTDVLGNHQSFHLPRSVWTSSLISYVFYIDLAGVLVYSKTTDGGLTWGSKVNFGAGFDARHTGIWFDQWTVGEAGTKIHAVFSDVTTDDLIYRNVDTADDSLSATAIILAGTSVTTGNTNNSIVRSRGGNLYASGWITAFGEKVFARSIDEGVSWSARTDVADGDAFDYAELYPANLADPNDLWAVYWDKSDNLLDLKTYDDSADTWTAGTLILFAINEATFRQMCSAVRFSDGHLFVAFWSRFNAAIADLHFFEINGEGSIVQRTDILTDTNNAFNCDILIDQGRDRIYVVYIIEDQIRYKISDDSGVTWGAEVTFSETDATHFTVAAGMSVPSGMSGRFQPVWFNDSIDDIITNQGNSLVIPPPTGGSAAIQASGPAHPAIPRRQRLPRRTIRKGKII